MSVSLQCANVVASCTAAATYCCTIDCLVPATLPWELSATGMLLWVVSQFDSLTLFLELSLTLANFTETKYSRADVSIQRTYH